MKKNYNEIIKTEIEKAMQDNEIISTVMKLSKKYNRNYTASVELVKLLNQYCFDTRNTVKYELFNELSEIAESNAIKHLSKSKYNKFLNAIYY